MIKQPTIPTAIYVDYENFYITLDEQYTSSPASKFDVIDRIQELYKNYRIKNFKLFCDFSIIGNDLRSLNSKFIELRHVMAMDSGYNRKNTSDIAMSIDIMSSLINHPEIEKYVLASSDSDMLPIIREIVNNGKSVDIICFKSFSMSTVYQELLSKLGVSCHMVEDLLNLVKFEKMSKIEFKQNEYRIKGELARVFGNYKERYPGKTPSIKDIRYSMEGYGYCKEDTADIIKFSFQENIIVPEEREYNGRTFRGIALRV